MKSLTVFSAMLLVAVAAAQSSVPSDRPSVDVTFPNRAQTIYADNVCKADFKSMKLVRNENSTAQLTQGHYNYRWKDGGFKAVTLDAVSCLQDESDSGQFAIVESIWTEGSGSSTSDCVVQVFALRSNRLVVTQQLEFDCQALSAGAVFNRKAHRLIIRARTDDDSPHCCAKSLDVVTYDWRNEKFVQVGFKRIPAVVKQRSDGSEIH
jgi:hypothetical protein